MQDLWPTIIGASATAAGAAIVALSSYFRTSRQHRREQNDALDERKRERIEHIYRRLDELETIYVQRTTDIANAREQANTPSPRELLRDVRTLLKLYFRPQLEREIKELEAQINLWATAASKVRHPEITNQTTADCARELMAALSPLQQSIYSLRDRLEELCPA